MAAVALKEGNVFVKRKHELADTLKAVDKVSRESIALIEKIMADEASETRKTRLDLAKWVLEYQARLVQQISQDELTRLMAEIKAKGLRTPLVPEDGDDRPKAPRLDMNNIQTV